MDEMITRQGMSRRPCKDGTEQDHLTGAHRFYVENHSVRRRIKTARNRRVRRQVRADLRQEG